jgi:ATP-dependent helicase/nuclease subunit B
VFERCRDRVSALPGAEVRVEFLNRDPDRSRFRAAPGLQQLEAAWPAGLVGEAAVASEGAACPAKPVRLVVCATQDAEATAAAREILRFVREGGRFRDAAILLRELDGYHHTLRRVFQRYSIPCFIDRREAVTHHPLAELTRYALRLAAFGWQHDDWFAVLKTGLVSADDQAIDLLENAALEHGWQGATWKEPVRIELSPSLESLLNRRLKEILPPFLRWTEVLHQAQRRPSAHDLVAALRQLWNDLGVEETLKRWSADSGEGQPPAGSSPVHLTVLDQMQEWLAGLDLAFGGESMPLSDWLPILEAGLANLTVGVIPPALDQVLIGAIDRSRNPEL